jgi:hypothetical protein
MSGRHQTRPDRNDFEEISAQLNQMLARSTMTEERLAKLERLRALEGARDQNEQSRKRPSFGAMLGEKPARSRPPPSDFHVSRRKGAPKSRDVTIDQIFESLQALRDEIADLTANHNDMIVQVNAIKRLIQ